jgi:hypothetical protein
MLERYQGDVLFRVEHLLEPDIGETISEGAENGIAHRTISPDMTLS